MVDSVTEMADVTYEQLEMVMNNPENAIKNEAWELIGSLIQLLSEPNIIPAKKMLEYARGIRAYSKEMYMEKLAGFQEKGRYSHCRELMKYWMIGERLTRILENIPDVTQ